MFRAGDEFLNTQFGNNNPYNQDNEISWLDWSQLEANQDIFRFFKLMISFRKNPHPSLCRSRFWREDISWYGVGPMADLSPDSHSLAFCLHGASQADDDVYVMINSYWKLQFEIQEEPFKIGLKNCGHRPAKSRRYLRARLAAAAVDLSSGAAIRCHLGPIQNNGHPLRAR